mmetsp:Transcript_36259/g.55435  ORF Transcript_36259/g.55435 Transcript_36259/m.55435 type:complete len:1061 (+) Transcript_36259:942-4124(+)
MNREEIQSLQTLADNLKEDLVTKEQEKNELNDKIVESKQVVMELVAAVEKSEEEVVQLTKQLDQERDTVEQMQSQLDTQAALLVDTDEELGKTILLLDEKEVELETAVTKHAEMEKITNEKIMDKTKALDSLLSDKKNMEIQLDALHESVDTMEDHLKQHEEKCTVLTDRIREVENQLREKDASIDQKQKELDRSLESCSKMEEDRTEAIAKCLSMEQELSDLKEKKEREEGEFDAIVKAQQKDLEEVSKRSETLKEEQDKQILDLKKSLTLKEEESKQVVTELISQINREESDKLEIMQYLQEEKEKSEQLEEELKVVKDELATSQVQLELHIMALNDMKSSQDAEGMQKITQMKMMEEEVLAAKASAQAIEQCLRGELDEANSSCFEYREKLETTKSQLMTIREENDFYRTQIDDLRAEYDLKQKDWTERQSYLETIMEEKADKLQSVKSQLEQSEDEQKKLISCLDELKLHDCEKEDEILNLQNEVELLRREILEKDDELLTESKKVENMVAEHKRGTSTYKNKILMLEVEVDSLQDKAKLDALETESTQEILIVELKEKVRTLESELSLKEEEMKSVVSELISELNVARRESLERVERSESVEKEFEDAKILLKQHEEELREKNENMQSLQKTKEDLEAALAKEREDNARGIIASLRQKLADSEFSAELLSQQVTDLTEDLEKAEETVYAEAERADIAEARLHQSNLDLAEASQEKQHYEHRLQSALEGLQNLENAKNAFVEHCKESLANENNVDMTESVCVVRGLLGLMNAKDETTKRKIASQLWKSLGKLSVITQSECDSHNLDDPPVASSLVARNASDTVYTLLPDEAERNALQDMEHSFSSGQRCNICADLGLYETLNSSSPTKNKCRSGRGIDPFYEDLHDIIKSHEVLFQDVLSEAGVSEMSTSKKETAMVVKHDVLQNFNEVNEFPLSESISEIGTMQSLQEQCDQLKSERDEVVHETLDLLESARIANEEKVKSVVANMRKDAASQLQLHQQDTKKRLLSLTQKMSERYEKMRAFHKWRRFTEEQQWQEKLDCAYQYLLNEGTSTEWE